MSACSDKGLSADSSICALARQEPGQVDAIEAKAAATAALSGGKSFNFATRRALVSLSLLPTPSASPGSLTSLVLADPQRELLEQNLPVIARAC